MLANSPLSFNPVHKVVLKAMNAPGRVFSLPHHDHGLGTKASLTAVTEALIHHDMGFILLSKHDPDGLADAVSEVTRSFRVSLEAADFVIVDGRRQGGEMLCSLRGVCGHPDRKATIIYLIAGTAHRHRRPYDISIYHPGHESEESLSMQGLSLAELNMIGDVDYELPFGTDCIFINATDQIMCIPGNARIYLRRKQAS